MTVEEIFSEISQQQIKGIMFHSDMVRYYDFLGLKGYAKCHKHHFFEEMKANMKLEQYYIRHFNKLLPELRFESTSPIPKNWHNYERQDVDANTKHVAVKEGLEKWVAWERSTKSLYERMYTELTGKGEVAARKIVEDLICDVSEELETAEQYHLNKKAIDFDIVSIIEEQNAIHTKYGCKMREK